MFPRIWDSLPVDVKDQIIFGYKQFINALRKHFYKTSIALPKLQIYMFNTFKEMFIDLPLMFNLQNIYLYIYILLAVLYKEIHSIVIQSAFGNPRGGRPTVNWFYFVLCLV